MAASLSNWLPCDHPKFNIAKVFQGNVGDSLSHQSRTEVVLLPKMT